MLHALHELASMAALVLIARRMWSTRELTAATLLAWLSFAMQHGPRHDGPVSPTRDFYEVVFGKR